MNIYKLTVENVTINLKLSYDIYLSIFRYNGWVCYDNCDDGLGFHNIIYLNHFHMNTQGVNDGALFW